MSQKFIAIYLRASTHAQNTRSQEPDLKRWAASQDEEVRWYRDIASGAKMERPALAQLEADIEAKRVSKVVIWRLDRLGRTAAGLTKFFADLRKRKVGLFSVKDSLDLETPAGRLMAGVLASCAEFEHELNRERIYAGIAAAKAKGKTWGGSKAGWLSAKAKRCKREVKRLADEKKPISFISRAVRLSRPTVRKILATAS